MDASGPSDRPKLTPGGNGHYLQTEYCDIAVAILGLAECLGNERSIPQLVWREGCLKLLGPVKEKSSLMNAPFTAGLGLANAGPRSQNWLEEPVIRWMSV
jgi:hypothetical protein